MSVLDRKELEESPLADLHAIANELGIDGYRRLRKDDLIGRILEQQGGDSGPAADDGGREEEEGSTDEDAGRPKRGRLRRSRRKRSEPEDEAPEADRDQEEAEPAEAEPAEAEPAEASADDEPEPEPEKDEPEEDTDETREGVLDILPNGSGFLREDPFSHSRDDVYVSPAQIRRCELRAGDQIAGPVRPPRRSERYPSLVRVASVNGQPPEPPQERPSFEDLTAVFASERLSSPTGLDAAPFGKGSRVAIGGAPGAGATTALRNVLSTLRDKHSDIDVVVVLAGVRPEEVTEWRRDAGDVPVAGGSFDTSPDEQAQVAEMAIERAKRSVEQGKDAAIIIDGLDALPTGVARRVFGAARNTEEAGSLTVIASTGTAGEPQRVATTRIVLEPSDSGEPSLGGGSGTTRSELLS